VTSWREKVNSSLDFEPITFNTTMQVHPSRSSRVQAQDLNSPPSRDSRRASPSYDSYDRPPHSQSHSQSQQPQSRRHDQDDDDEDRERRAIEREERRGGGRERLTPERELGYGGRFPQQTREGYGQRDRGGYQGPQGGGYQGRQQQGGGGGGRGSNDDWLDSYAFALQSTHS